MIYLFWFVGAVLVGWYADRKGFNPGINFLVALLLSPLIGALIVLVREPNRKEIEGRAVRAGEMRRCPKCAELIRAEATVCRFCQASISETAEAVASTESIAPPSVAAVSAGFHSGRAIRKLAQRLGLPPKVLLIAIVLAVIGVLVAAVML